MPQSHLLSEREKALEELFFRKENERLIEAMRARKTREEQLEKLSEALGVDSPPIVETLLDLGLRETNVTALMLAPLVTVAWADRQLHPDERRSILKAEHDLGIDPKSDAGKLLELWLDHRPHESLFDAWKAYVHELARKMPPEERAKLRDEILSRARRIAHAVEKTLLRGEGPTESEQRVLDEIEAAFEVPADGSGKGSGGGGLDQAICSTT
ncbi:MAG TPA: hypothetical protein ENI85_06815 [Deltaproteobacteria bacterium]|nr:hypothetical protein [Deltaproteobacteria bacterium]